MERVSNFFAIPGILAFVALVLWDNEIKSISHVLYYLVLVIFLVGLGSSLIQSRRVRDQSIAERAITRYKEEAGIE